MEQPIIPPVPVQDLLGELTPDRKLRTTARSNNEVYVIDAHNAPNVMREIGRLREEAFRAAGGGTGFETDIDEFDTMPQPYRQLIVWDPEEQCIMGGYRFILGSEVTLQPDGQPHLATSHMFHFSERFMRDFMPYTIELGRSFVTLRYQNTTNGIRIPRKCGEGSRREDSTNLQRKGLFALDNLWDGLGALTVVMPNVRYLFGKMTMYPTYDRKARDMILFFLQKHFGDPDQLIIPMHPLHIEADPERLRNIFCEDEFRADYRILNREVRALGYDIPPLVNAYMNLSPTMRMFGTAINDGFGDVEETGILIDINELFDEKRVRYIDSFARQHPDAVAPTSGANVLISRQQ